MDSETPLLWLQEYDNHVWERVMVELVKCRKKKVNTEFELKWEDLITERNTNLRWYDYMRWNNSRRYIRFITNNKYYICNSELIDYKFINKLFVYGFKIQIIQPEAHEHINNPINLIYFIENYSYQLENKINYLIKSNNIDELYEYDCTDFKFMCLQEEKNNRIIYCGMENRYIKLI